MFVFVITAVFHKGEQESIQPFFVREGEETSVSKPQSIFVHKGGEIILSKPQSILLNDTLVCEGDETEQKAAWLVDIICMSNKGAIMIVIMMAIAIELSKSKIKKAPKSEHCNLQHQQH